MIDKEERKRTLRILKAERTKLNNKKVDSLYEFEKTQNRLNELDLLIEELSKVFQ